jgi:hypothetical protein
MLHLFEAAHSAVLACLSCPHNAALTANLVPFYAETLFASFPQHISPRQFRLAFKTVVQILSPPRAISAEHPELAEGLLEMVRWRVGVAGTGTGTGVLAQAAVLGGDAGGGEEQEVVVSEQSTLVLTLVDALPFLSVRIFEEWMGLVAGAVNMVRDAALREVVKRRFWEVLVSGEMDVERAAIAAAWWGTKGGREAVLFGRTQPGVGLGYSGHEEEGFMMRGALVEEQGRESRL